MSAGAAWYVKVREVFVRDTVQTVVGELASNATREGLHVEPEQHEEWRSSVGVLQKELRDRAGEIALLKETLAADDLADYRHVLLEFDFRRRGLRMDCVLLGDGVIVVVEFKRSRLTAADREQVTNYAVNLVEFHEETRRLILDERLIVAPVLALTSEARVEVKARSGFLGAPWDGVLERPVECNGANLHTALLFVLKQRRARGAIDCSR